MLEGLQQYAAQIGVPLSDEQAQAMRTYWAAVLETNRHTNLTRITDDKEATLKHFIDSLSVLPTGVFGPGARVADVGTGAGFPGVPLKIARPDLQLVLIDSTLKRVRFLRSVIRLLGWDDVEAVHARAEALAADPKWAGTFDLVVARAVAKLDALANWCLPLLRPGGRLVAMKGPDVAEELKEAAGALAAGGGRLVKVERLALPEGAGRRSIVIVERTGAG
ncbi:MAG: 16S rRNA (guanine(527)-N(7))-methyltransferase RsmG [Limnochordales bacterium]|nr:MAG: 16S rRNA (guanine(527)-N(7))-methyltransferase RsmG [Bacillota bacterium]